MAKNYEVEVKSLLGTAERAKKLKHDLLKHVKGVKLLSQEKQLNHYFNPPADLATFAKEVASVLPDERRTEFEELVNDSRKISVRTRQSNTGVLLVLKISVGDDTSDNGVRRVEFEQKVSMSLDELDKVLISAGCSYQAKWSREREEYSGKDVKVCIDRNAGYGYLAEFEKVVSDENEIADAHKQILDMMRNFGVDELPQDRLERMFDYYNKNWKDYYGTENTFIIE